MSEYAIEAEGLSKCYLIPQGESQGRYRTLRDTLAGGVRGLASRLARQGEPRDREFWALKDVSFRIAKGERVGIIGANGAGKSTLLKLLSRIVAPTAGRARVTGRLSALLEVGTGFHPELTGAENIRLNAALLGMSSAELARVFDAIVDFSGVSEHLNVPVKRYSSGMYTRLAFAVAAHLEPDVLIVDEVLAVGDAAFQRKCVERMKTLNETGQTLLCVSHNMSLVASLCTSALVLDKGRVVYSQGPVEAAINAYNQSIADRSERNLLAPTIGVGKLRIVSVHCGSTTDATDASVQTGQPFYINVAAIAVDPVASDEPFQITVSIVNSYGHLVGFSDSAHWNTDVCTDEAGQAFLFRIDPFNYGPGSYHLNVAVTRNGDLEDVVYHAIFFSVFAGESTERPIFVPNGIECDLAQMRLISAASLKPRAGSAP